MNLLPKERLHPANLFVGSFGLVIIIGTCLLKLPLSTVKPISWIDALFTATSATCVTGLSVVDVSTTFTLFGQGVILLLIQTGGVGIITFSTVLLTLLGRPVSIQDRFVAKDALDRFNMRIRVGPLLTRVVVLTFLTELAGALALAVHWWDRFPPHVALYYALFHAVSAYCNAGFSLFSNGLLSFREDWVVTGVMGTLIFLGGIGFLVQMEIADAVQKWKWKAVRRLSLHSKLALSVSGVLIVLGAVLIFMFEQNQSLKGLSLFSQINSAVFQSISNRTAGFQTIDFYTASNGTIFVVILLMFVGASPGSTGGGIKTTTFGILVGIALCRVKAREDVVSLFRRTVPQSTVAQSIGIFVLSVHVLMLFFVFLLISGRPPASLDMERRIFVEILFEAVSAFGTVGNSMGITPSLTWAGKFLIVCLMFIGRVGPLTVSVALGKKIAKGQFQYSEEGVMIG